MGPLGELMEKFPLFGELPEGFQFDDTALDRIVAMVDSMTPAERQRPDSINEQRIRRVAKGSGRKEKDVKRPAQAVPRHARRDARRSATPRAARAAARA